MEMYISYDSETNELKISKDSSIKRERRKKGNSLLSFPETYTVIDIETTGLSSNWDNIIELSAIKILNGKIIDKFSTLVKPDKCFVDENGNDIYISEFITELTKITNEMLKSAPMLTDVLERFIGFIGNSIIVGHNVNFDINFIYDDYKGYFNKEFKNDFCDLLRISRHLFPEFENHKLDTLAKNFSIVQKESHRGLVDCITTFECFEYCRKYCIENNIDLLSLIKKKTDLREIKTSNTEFDEQHPLFKKVCVFTGKLELMTRADAAQLVVDVGGICENSVTKRTNYLILGNNDYCTAIKDGKSSKQKKAESLILKGRDIQIMPEDVFYDMILDK